RCRASARPHPPPLPDALPTSFAPPSLLSMKIFGLSGLNQTEWLSPCGVSTAVHVRPPSVEWWKPSSVTHTSTDGGRTWTAVETPDRKSTRLNSSHGSISYPVF